MGNFITQQICTRCYMPKICVVLYNFIRLFFIVTVVTKVTITVIKEGESACLPQSSLCV